MRAFTMALGSSEQTEQTLCHHVQAFAAGDVEAIMADYTADAVFITPDGMLRGHAQIRALFEQMFATIFPPDSTALNLAKQVVEGDIAYILWLASSAHDHAPWGTDTFPDAQPQDRRTNLGGPAGGEVNCLTPDWHLTAAGAHSTLTYTQSTQAATSVAEACRRHAVKATALTRPFRSCQPCRR
jgi:ketosteroid isomerase-like protein